MELWETGSEVHFFGESRRFRSHKLRVSNGFLEERYARRVGGRNHQIPGRDRIQHERYEHHSQPEFPRRTRVSAPGKAAPATFGPRVATEWRDDRATSRHARSPAAA